MRFLLAVALLVHGFAHLVGFVVPWRLANLKEMPYKTTILADAVNVGDTGIRLVGVLWLLTALAFTVCSVAVATRAQWWPSATLTVACLSFILCIIGLPDARIGVWVNVVIIAAIVVGPKVPTVLQLVNR